MSEAKFKTMRHIETVRNYLDAMVFELLARGRDHDQSKLQSPEVEVFEEYTTKLRGCAYGSPEYKQNMDEMRVAIDHHQAHNRHHPEHHEHGIVDMTLIDLLEMLCDWKAATMRHADGNIYRSLEINRERLNYDIGIGDILKNTIDWMEGLQVEHHASES